MQVFREPSSSSAIFGLWRKAFPLKAVGARRLQRPGSQNNIGSALCGLIVLTNLRRAAAQKEFAAFSSTAFLGT
jgi:hypothetical protein